MGSGLRDYLDKWTQISVSSGRVVLQLTPNSQKQAEKRIEQVVILQEYDRWLFFVRREDQNNFRMLPCAVSNIIKLILRKIRYITIEESMSRIPGRDIRRSSASVYFMDLHSDGSDIFVSDAAEVATEIGAARSGTILLLTPLNIKNTPQRIEQILSIKTGSGCIFFARRRKHSNFERVPNVFSNDIFDKLKYHQEIEINESMSQISGLDIWGYNASFSHIDF